MDMGNTDNPRTLWDQLETTHKPDAVCPYCGYVDRDAWELFIGDQEDAEEERECGECGKTYFVERIVYIKYSTERMEERQ